MSRTWPSLDVRFLAPAGERRELDGEAVATVLHDCQPTAVLEDAGHWLVSFPASAARDLAVAALTASLGEVVAVVPFEASDDDWAARSQAGIAPVRVGHLIVSPPWHDPAVDRAAGDHLVVVVPSMGFGTGHHATTRLCLAALQTLALPGRRVVDVGTGSGVLALAAAALGAARVVAIDDDPDAVESARENVALNGLDGQVELVCADVRSLPALEADVVLANLTGALLVHIAGRLADTVSPGGCLIASGFTATERDAVLRAVEPRLQIDQERTEDEWGMALFTRPVIPAPSAWMQDVADGPRRR